MTENASDERLDDFVRLLAHRTRTSDRQSERMGDPSSWYLGL